MSNTTGIEWTDSTWNPIRGCSRVSEGCRNCYAERVAYRFSGPGRPYEGLAQLVNGHAAWTGKVDLVEKHLLDPLKWGPIPAIVRVDTDGVRRKLESPLRPRRIFVNSMSDLFHPNVPDEWIDRIFAVMALCPQHTFQVLTKRPERMLAYLSDAATNERTARASVFIVPNKMLSDKGIEPDLQQEAMAGWADWPLPNVQLGVSVEDQPTADERIPLLLQTPAAVRFISAEPLLGAIDLNCIAAKEDPEWFSTCLTEQDIYWTKAGEISDGPDHGKLDWVICGGESGPGARPMHPDWARGLRDQCVAAGVPFFFKQWGEWTEVGGGPPHHLHDVEGCAPPIDAVNCVLSVDGHRPKCASELRDRVRYRWLSRVGKKAAGSLLDGREWKEFPCQAK